MNKIGFDNDKYLDMQSKHIKERIGILLIVVEREPNLFWITAARITDRTFYHGTDIASRNDLMAEIDTLCVCQKLMVSDLILYFESIFSFLQYNAAILKQHPWHEDEVDLVESDPVSDKIFISFKTSLSVIHEEIDQFPVSPSAILF